MAFETDWRRKWKPNLRTSSWRLIETDNEMFHIKSVFQGNTCEIMLTDFVVVWHELLDADGIIKRTKKLNPSVEAPLSKITDHLSSFIQDGKKGADFSSVFKAGSDGEDSKIILTMNTKLAGLPFTWKFYGSPLNKEEFHQHLTQPLVIMVSELARRQQQLFALMKQKDKEIEDLVAQNVRVSRKHLETGKFDETVFINNMTASKEFSSAVETGSCSVFASSGDLQREVIMKRAYLSRGPDDTDDDEVMEDGEAGMSGAASATSWSNRIPTSLISSSSPTKSSTKSPNKPDASPTKDTELLRREALAKRLAEDEEKKSNKAKKKKKIKF